jgi:hypothetical protein
MRMKRSQPDALLLDIHDLYLMRFNGWPDLTGRFVYKEGGSWL